MPPTPSTSSSVVSKTIEVNRKQLSCKESEKSFISQLNRTTIKLLILIACVTIEINQVQAGFWTFYFPNFLKPSGYSELSDIIWKIEANMNATKDAFADSQYFWGQMQDLDKIDESSMYPEDSACSEVFPLFRDKAIEYTYIDYEHYIKPMELYRDYLLQRRIEWFPEGELSKTILPREWEQNLYKRELQLTINWHSKLTNEHDFRQIRENLINVWSNIKRSLDTSLACVYMRYAYRHIAEDINQLALDSNLTRMRAAMDMVNEAYDRIEKFQKSDQKAQQEISESIIKDRRYNIRD